MSVFHAWRPPRAVATRVLEPPHAGAATVELVVAQSPSNALDELLGQRRQRVAECVLLVTVTTPAPWIAGLSSTLDQNNLDLTPTGRAARRAIARGPLRDVKRYDLADGDWVRWDFPGSGFQFDHAFMPARIEPPADVVALPGRAETDSPAELWLSIAHPHTAARIRAAPDRAALLAELLTGVRARFIIGFSTRTPPRPGVAAATDHPIAAQLLWRAAQRIAGGHAGFESTTPWEDSIVQAAAQLGFGPAFGDQLTIHLSEASASNQALADRLRELLDCRIM